MVVAGVADRDEIGEMARAVQVFQANAIKLLEHRHQLERLNGWLDIALNNMKRGLSMFDAEQNLLVCNAAYAQIYGLPPELTRPGAPFSRLSEHRAKLVARTF